ncbi:hypothetical protein EB821_05970 [Candidatus Marinimicrobia bacterium PRS2]|jgi:DNA repair protein RadC|nr:hypothetical protein EB821_05970 [Candidatus Marinimicrobia bacterium PRS2]
MIEQISDNELHREYVKRFTIPHGEIFNCSEAVGDHLRAYFSKDPYKEVLVVIFLNGRNGHLRTETLSEGTITTSSVYPREIIRKALEYGAVALILGHNHPSGNPTPSSDDQNITKKIVNACKTVDITVHDHIIMAGGTYTSFADKGLI